MTHAHADGRRIVVAGLGPRAETTPRCCAARAAGAMRRARPRRPHGCRGSARRPPDRAPAGAGRGGGGDPRHVPVRPLQAREGRENDRRAPARGARRAAARAGGRRHAAGRELRPRDVIRARPDQRAGQRAASHRPRARGDRAGEGIAHRGQGVREGRVQEDGHGRLPGRCRGERAAAEVHPPDLPAVWTAARRAQAQKVVLIGKGITFDSGGLDLKTARRHAADEVRHGRRRCRARDHARAAGAEIRGRGSRADRGDREHAVRLGHPSGRHPARDERHDDRDRQHRRRGAPDARRRALLRQHEHPARRDHRYGDADRGVRHRARPALLGAHDEQPGAGQSAAEGRRRGRRAALAAPADRRVPRQSEERGGRHQQRRTTRRRRDHRGAVPEGVRRQDAVGAPRHRGAGLHGEGSAAGPEGRHRLRRSGRSWRTWETNGCRARSICTPHDRVRRHARPARAGAPGRAPRRPRPRRDRPRLHGRSRRSHGRGASRTLSSRSSPVSRSTATFRAPRSTSSATAWTGKPRGSRSSSAPSARSDGSACTGSRRGSPSSACRSIRPRSSPS